MADLHPNHPDYQRHDQQTGEVDEDVTGVEILDPISIGALATLQRVEIDQQVATAKAYPRNVTQLRKELTALVTMDEDTADDCIYALPRGKKHIKGPSARFADALISFWGNARSGSFITQVNRDEKFVEAIGSFQDVERNVIRQRRVRRPIVTSQGQIYNLDMINMTGNAACVIAERNAILNGIPKSLWSGAYEQAFALVAGTTKTLGEKLERATKAFAIQGITMDQVLEKLGHQDLTKIIPDDIVTMRGMLTALKTGEETVETIFGRGAPSNHEKVQNPLKDDPAPARGGSHLQNIASTVIDWKGNVVKSRDGEAVVGPVLDQRFREGHQFFETLAAWSEATARVDRPVFNKPDPITSGPQRTETASNEGAKNDTAAGKAEEKDPDKPAADVQSAEKTAQAGAAAAPAGDLLGAKPYTDADGYMGFMRDNFDSAKARASKSAVTEIWGSTRADRNELLSADQIEELTKDKAATLAAIKLKEPK
jgi:hypothetical protein